MTRYEQARDIYKALGVDTEKALETLKDVTVSVHCWQGDDVVGFDSKQALSGGIQTTGNYPGKATTPEQLMADIDKAFSLMPGKLKLNLHANYAIFEDGEFADRNELKPCHFAKWVEFAKAHGVGIDFNPTYFSHAMVKDGLTLSSPDEKTRKFWVEHGIACLKIAEYFAEETGIPCVMNIWIPDGYKDIPGDRLGPRARFKKSLDEILATGYDKSKVYVTLESKVFGIGVESYTVGSAEFTLSYSTQNGLTPLMDNGHYHPTEVVSDKISALLLFNEKIALHVTREIAKEIVRNDALDRVFIATDYFDASINRISAWVTGVRNISKSLLFALLQPNAELKKLQDENDMTALMALSEELKTAPFGDVWAEFLNREGICSDYLSAVKEYEKKVLVTR